MKTYEQFIKQVMKAQELVYRFRKPSKIFLGEKEIAALSTWIKNMQTFPSDKKGYEELMGLEIIRVLKDSFMEVL